VARLELTIHLHFFKGEAVFEVMRLLSKLRKDEALGYTVISLEYVRD